MNIEEMKKKLEALNQIPVLEVALDNCKRAAPHDAQITEIKAHDQADSHRSVVYTFSAEDSAVIFETVQRVLEDRLASLRVMLEGM